MLAVNADIEKLENLVSIIIFHSSILGLKLTTGVFWLIGVKIIIKIIPDV